MQSGGGWEVEGVKYELGRGKVRREKKMIGWEESVSGCYKAVCCKTGCKSLHRRSEIFLLRYCYFSCFSPARYNSDDDSSSVASATHIG